MIDVRASRRSLGVVLAGLILTSLGAGICFAPALTMLSEAAESSRLHQGFAAGLSNMAWAAGAGGRRGRRRRRGERHRRRRPELRDRRPAARDRAPTPAAPWRRPPAASRPRARFRTVMADDLAQLDRGPVLRAGRDRPPALSRGARRGDWARRPRPGAKVSVAGSGPLLHRGGDDRRHDDRARGAERRDRRRPRLAAWSGSGAGPSSPS